MTEKEILAALSDKANDKANIDAQKEQKVCLETTDTSSDTSEKVQETISTSSTDTKEMKEDFEGFPTPEMFEENSENRQSDTNAQEASQKDFELAKSEVLDHAEAKETQLQSVNTQEKTQQKQEENEEDEEEHPMTLLEHLRELRVRLTRVLIVIFIGFFLCYSISEVAYNILAAPLLANMPGHASLIYTSPPGAFFVYLKVALVLSFFISCPYTFYQVWAFVAPGLYREEKRILMPLAFISAFFFIAGATFCYFMVFPIAFKFFMSFATVAITPMISIEEYLSFVLKLLIAFGLVFEMPLFAFFLSRMGILTAKRMRTWRKYAVLLVFIVAALLTPPDIFSQLLMAGPMLLLYEVSVWIAFFVEKKKNKEKEEAEAKAKAEEDTKAAQESVVKQLEEMKKEQSSQAESNM